MATAESNMAKHLPAPSTFAPSRNDVLSSLSFFFGDPASPEKLRDYSEHQAQTYHFPDAFTGSNNRIRDTLNNLVLKVRLSVQTKCCVSCLEKYVLFVLSHTNALVMFLLPQSPQDWQTSVGLPLYAKYRIKLKKSLYTQNHQIAVLRFSFALFCFPCILKTASRSPEPRLSGTRCASTSGCCSVFRQRVIKFASKWITLLNV